MSLDIPPAVDTSWRNDAQAATDALIILGLNTVGPEYARMLEKAHEAGDQICLYLDRLTPIPGVVPQIPPPPLRGAHADVTLELWRRKDAPYGIANAWADDQQPATLDADPLAGVYPRINPYKARWGLA